MACGLGCSAAGRRPGQLLRTCSASRASLTAGCCQDADATSAQRAAFHLRRLERLLRRASDNAMATACFCGLPAAISVRMFELMVLREEPFFNGIISLLCASPARAKDCSMDVNAKAVAGYLRHERLRREVTQVQLAKKLGWSQRFVSAVEMNKRRLSIEQYIAICKALGLDPGPTLSKIFRNKTQ